MKRALCLAAALAMLTGCAVRATYYGRPRAHWVNGRVRYERAPFDHPELCVSIGHIQPRRGTVQGTRLPATDRFALVPAVGARGNHVPLQTFEELLRGIGSDGSRAHSLTETCQKN